MQKFAVIGLGRFGQQLARALVSGGAEVIAIDRNAKLAEQMRDDVTLAVCLDGTDEEAMTAQGVDEVDVAVVGIGDHFEASALCVATLKNLGVPRIIARAQSEIQAKILRRVGADEIAAPEGESALRWGHRLTMPNLKQYIDLGEGHSLVYVSAPIAFHHKTLAELNLRNAFGVNLVALERSAVRRAEGEAEKVRKSAVEVPKADTKILPGDTLILVGSNESIASLPRE
jgi:trk system potassium uptake protein TrkA